MRGLHQCLFLSQGSPWMSSNEAVSHLLYPSFFPSLPHTRQSFRTAGWHAWLYAVCLHGSLQPKEGGREGSRCSRAVCQRRKLLPVESPSLDTFKSRLDIVLGTLPQLALFVQRGQTSWPPEVPSSPNHSGVPKPSHPNAHRASRLTKASWRGLWFVWLVHCQISSLPTQAVFSVHWLWNMFF